MIKAFLVWALLFSNFFGISQKSIKLGYNAPNIFIFNDLRDKQYLFELKKLSPTYLRFPGGAIANFYHPFSKTSKYGFLKAEIDMLRDSNLKNRFGEYLIKDSISYSGRNALEELINLKSQIDFEVIYVANITTGSLDDIVKEIETLLANEIKLVGIELGNELYFHFYDKIISLEEYLEKGKVYAKRLKLEFDTIDIGIVLPHAQFIDGDFKFLGDVNDNFDAWIEAISRESFYDAIILHDYAHVNSNCWAPNKVDCRWNNLTDYIDVYMEQTFRKYGEIFYKKDIWITEWNLMGFHKNFLTESRHLTYIHLYLAKLFDINKQVSNRITNSFYHSLSVKGTGDLISNFSGEIHKNAPFDFFVNLEKIESIDSTRVTYFDVAKNAGKVDFFSELKVYSYYFNHSESNFEVVANEKLSLFRYDDSTKSLYQILDKEAVFELNKGEICVSEHLIE